MKASFDLTLDELESYDITAEDYGIHINYNGVSIYHQYDSTFDLRDVLEAIEKHAKENR